MSLNSFDEEAVYGMMELEIGLAARQRADALGVRFNVKCQKVTYSNGSEGTDVLITIENESIYVEEFKDYMFDLVTNVYSYSNDVRFA